MNDLIQAVTNQGRGLQKAEENIAKLIAAANRQAEVLKRQDETIRRLEEKLRAIESGAKVTVFKKPEAVEAEESEDPRGVKGWDYSEESDADYAEGA